MRDERQCSQEIEGKAIIIRNVKTFEDLIELLDEFDQAGPSNTNSGNNDYYYGQNRGSYPNVRGETQFSNQSNFRGRNFTPNTNTNDFGATSNFAQQNRNYNYNRGHGFAGQNYRNNHFSFPNNGARFKGHKHAPASQPGTNQAHDNNRRDMRDRSYNPRPSGNVFVQNGVYHRHEIVNPSNIGANELGRYQSGNVKEATRKVRAVAYESCAIQGRSIENSSVLSNSESDISNFATNVETINNQGN